MYIKNRRISLIYKIIATLIALGGQILAMGIFSGNINFKTYFYYTQQSNVLCLVYFVISTVFCIRTIKKDGPTGPCTFAPRFKGAVVMAITVTMLIYWFMLHSPGKFQPIHMLENYTTHLFVPLLTILDWLLFDKKGEYKKYDPVLWLCIPLVYYAFALIVAQTGVTFYGGSRFPYFFIDTDLLGVGKVTVYVMVLVLVFLVIGYIVYAADWMLGKKKKK